MGALFLWFLKSPEYIYSPPLSSLFYWLEYMTSLVLGKLCTWKKMLFFFLSSQGFTIKYHHEICMYFLGKAHSNIFKFRRISTIMYKWKLRHEHEQNFLESVLLVLTKTYLVLNKDVPAIHCSQLSTLQIWTGHYYRPHIVQWGRNATPILEMRIINLPKVT